jgi:hypothetical protein
MMARVRMFACVAIITTSHVAHAQLVDPFSDTPTTPPATTDAGVAPQDAPPAQPAKPPKPPPPPMTLKMRRPGDWIEHHAPILRPRVLRDPPPIIYQAEEPTRRYPYELSARPLVLPPGVTEVGLAYQRFSATVTQPDSVGRVMTERAAVNYPDLYVSHAFSRAELGIGIGAAFYGWIAVDTKGRPQRVLVGLAFSAPQPDGRYFHSQGLTLSHKLFGGPETALVCHLSAYSHELDSYNDVGARVEGAYLVSRAAVTFQAQVSERFGVEFGGGVTVPVAQDADLHVGTTVSGSALMLLAAESWDFVLGFAIENPTEVFERSLTVGVRKRFGL